MPSGRYESGSCADVWSVTTSISTPRRSSSGNTVAALPTTPTDSGVDERFAARHRPTAEGAPPAVERPRQRLGAAHAAAAAGEGERAGQGPAEPLGGDSGEGLVG